eukprot:gnl/Carplike_NY0171/4277_a5793_261.p1 GENE.gnl/Carplike_NY0171/4277_a5793_261~~gnl/Carplike_NY0171/4277_a5793_261.p1  ORF type:complete len:497 (+),score=183.80 gnl/Carplike_NY0171/4277_a5793_261:182-1492(+)
MKEATFRPMINPHSAELAKKVMKRTKIDYGMTSSTSADNDKKSRSKKSASPPISSAKPPVPILGSSRSLSSMSVYERLTKQKYLIEKRKEEKARQIKESTCYHPTINRTSIKLARKALEKKEKEAKKIQESLETSQEVSQPSSVSPSAKPSEVPTQEPVPSLPPASTRPSLSASSLSSSSSSSHQSGDVPQSSSHQLSDSEVLMKKKLSEMNTHERLYFMAYLKNKKREEEKKALEKAELEQKKKKQARLQKMSEYPNGYVSSSTKLGGSLPASKGAGDSSSIASISAGFAASDHVVDMRAHPYYHSTIGGAQYLPYSGGSPFYKTGHSSTGGGRSFVSSGIPMPSHIDQFSPPYSDHQSYRPPPSSLPRVPVGSFYGRPDRMSGSAEMSHKSPSPYVPHETQPTAMMMGAEPYNAGNNIIHDFQDVDDEVRQLFE